LGCWKNSLSLDHAIDPPVPFTPRMDKNCLNYQWGCIQSAIYRTPCEWRTNGCPNLTNLQDQTLQIQLASNEFTACRSVMRPSPKGLRGGSRQSPFAYGYTGMVNTGSTAVGSRYAVVHVMLKAASTNNTPTEQPHCPSRSIANDKSWSCRHSALQVTKVRAHYRPRNSLRWPHL
jgi:hypothetical protein